MSCSTAQALAPATDERFHRLYAEQHGFLSRMAVVLCGNRAVAQDLVQETWLRAWRYIDTLGSLEAGRAWLVTILRREQARLYRRFGAELTTLDEVSEQTSPDDQSFNRVLIDQLLDGLDEDARRLLEGRVLEDLSYKELAGRMGSNVNTVAIRLHRLRKQLAEKG